MRTTFAFILPAVVASISLSALAGVAPTAPNSALSQSGARIAAPAKPVAEDRDDKKEHSDTAAKELAK